MKLKRKTPELRVLTDAELKAVSGGAIGPWCTPSKGGAGSGILPPPIFTVGPAATPYML